MPTSTYSSAYAKAQYLKHRERVLARMKVTRSSTEYRKKARLRWRQKADFVARYKLAAGCFDCGYKEYPEALQFDHVSGTKKGIIGQFLDKSWGKLLAEIEKCEVRCANCHAVATKRRQ